MSVRSRWSNVESVRSAGGIQTLAALRRDARKLLSFCQRIMKTTKMEVEAGFDWDLSRLDFLFLQSGDANAIVTREKDRHLVGIFCGLPLQLLETLRVALADQRVLRLYLRAAEREEFAWRFVGMAIEHVFLHECAHALRGHIDFLDQREPTIAIDELRNNSNVRSERSVMVELDADVHALDLWWVVTFDSDALGLPKKALLDLLFQKLLVMLLLHQLFDRRPEEVRAKRSAKRTHPTPVHRAMMLSSTLAETFATELNLPRKSVTRVVKEAWWEAGEIARVCGGMRGRWWGPSTERMDVEGYGKLRRGYLKKFESEFDNFASSLSEKLV